MSVGKTKIARNMKNRNRASGLRLGFALGVVGLLTVAAGVPAGLRAQAKPPAAAVADGDIVARVNNDVITLAEYRKGGAAIARRSGARLRGMYAGAD